MAKPKRPVSIDGIEFDALITSSETHSAEIPDYPCEEGYSVHDTVITKPLEISMTLFLTNNPVTWYNRFGRDRDRVQIVEEKLRSLFAERKLITVLTATDKYKNMGITSVSIDKSKENGSGRSINISLKQVSITKTQTANVPDSYGKSGTTMANAGTAGTGSTETAQSGSSTSSAEEEKSTSKSKCSMLYSAASKLGMV